MGQASLRPEASSYSKEIFKLGTFPVHMPDKYRDHNRDIAYYTCLSLYERSNKYHNKNRGFFSFRGLQHLQSGGKSIRNSITSFFQEIF